MRTSDTPIGPRLTVRDSVTGAHFGPYFGPWR
jgi:hypothetical protein